MMKIIRSIASPRNFTAGKNKKNQHIIIHYVGGVSSAKRNAENLQNNQTGTSAQYFIDPTSIYQTVEDFDIGWGCSAINYKHPTARNSNSIHIEMCCKRTDKGVWYIEADTVKNTIELTAHLMDKHNIPLANVLRHYDVTGKHCPEPFVRIPSLWNDFRKSVKAAFNGQSITNDITPYRVRKTADDAASQLQAYNNLESAKDLANRNPGYEVYDQQGNLIYDPMDTVLEYKNYRVNPNDSWWKIAASQMGNGLRMYELAKFNGRTEKSIIHPGEIIKVPA